MSKEKNLDFIEIYNQQNSVIYKYILFRTGFNKEIAEDLTQEVFYRALKKFKEFNYNGIPVNIWLFKIARNIVIDFYRSNNVYTLNIEAIPEIGVENSNSELVIFILQKIDMLKDLERDIIIYKYVYGLTDKEIADVINKNRIATRVILHRSLVKLRNLVDGK